MRSKPEHIVDDAIMVTESYQDEKKNRMGRVHNNDKKRRSPRFHSINQVQNLLLMLIDARVMLMHLSSDFMKNEVKQWNTLHLKEELFSKKLTMRMNSSLLFLTFGSCIC